MYWLTNRCIQHKPKYHSVSFSRSAEGPGPLVSREASLGGQCQVTVGEPDRGPFGLAGIAKQLAFQRIETVTGCKEAIAVRIAHDDSGRLRADFDDVGVRHF